MSIMYVRCVSVPAEEPPPRLIIVLTTADFTDADRRISPPVPTPARMAYAVQIRPFWAFVAMLSLDPQGGATQSRPPPER
jgi:hypothetical protein